MDIKKMDLQEFFEKGYLQEVNRQFLHPLGLALEMSFDDTNGSVNISGVWDYRDDPEGVIFDLKNSNDDRKNKFKNKARYIENEKKKFSEYRTKNLGWDIEPIE